MNGELGDSFIFINTFINIFSSHSDSLAKIGYTCPLLKQTKNIVLVFLLLTHVRDK